MQEKYPDFDLPRYRNPIRQMRVDWPVQQWQDVHVALAVSGGADSMALLRAMHSIRAESGGMGKLYVIHVDHQLRQAESAADTKWIVKQCESLGIPATVCRANAQQLADEQRDGLESAAREERYRLLTGAAEQLGARYIATGHTADDQAETVMFRILRGSGLHGLSGMRRTRSLSSSITLVRPLLGCQRQDLLVYLRSLGQSFREDSSNDDLRFTRNQIRQDLLPRLRSEYNPQLDAALVRLADQAWSAQQFIESHAKALLDQCALESFKSGSNQRPARQCLLALKVTRLADQSELLVCEALRLAWREAGLSEQSMTHRWWRQLAALAQSQGKSPQLNLPGNIRAELIDQRLTFSSISSC